MARGRNWSQEKLARIARMKAERRTWREIDKAEGEKPGAWLQRHHYYETKRRVAELKARVRAECIDVVRKAPPVARNVSPANILTAPSPPPQPVEQRQRYVHLEDAETCARIARQGITAGILGDPPPGRSALDQRQAG